MLVEFRKQFFW